MSPLRPVSVLSSSPDRAPSGSAGTSATVAATPGTNLTATAPPGVAGRPHPSPSGGYPWRERIVTTVFWIGENATRRNPVANQESSWDARWRQDFGGCDDPRQGARAADYRPAAFTPGQNPFYVALPYNDVTRHGTKPEAAAVVPWFQAAFRTPGQSVCKGRWVAVRRSARTCYAQWEDAGPYATDDWPYVFGAARPRPNPNHGAGLDVSPAVRDYLDLTSPALTDWRFVETTEVPPGPWIRYGANNLLARLPPALPSPSPLSPPSAPASGSLAAPAPTGATGAPRPGSPDR